MSRATNKRRATSKRRGHEREPNETTETHLTPSGDTARAAQSGRRIPRANNFLHLKITN